jgi:ferredoxin
MGAKKLSKNELEQLVDSLISSQKSFGVQKKGERFNFDFLESASDLRLDYDVSLQPPKKYFLPPVETLLTFHTEKGYESNLDNEPFCLIGVHPYDIHAISQMDEIFSQDNYDTHYMTRRKNATIIACDVANASENVFAGAMGTATAEEGFDAIITDIGEGYVIEAATDKGEKVLEKVKDAADASTQDIEKRSQIRKDNKKKLTQHSLDCDRSYLPKLLARAYEHPIFEEKAKTCFSCGSCTQVCPTCYCFNVQDDVNWDLDSGERKRSWDGCMLDGFTKVAGDHEFRKDRTERLKHRIYRKGKYVPAKIGGRIACVGCGRCVDACLPQIANPVDIYNALVKDIGII